MPTVPAAGYPTGPEAPPAVPLDVPGGDYQRIQATPEAFGAQVGGALKEAGRTLEQGAGEFAQAAIARQQLTNQIVSDQKQSEYVKGANNILFGDPNAPPGSPEAMGFYGLHGQQAIDAGPKINQQLDDLEAKTRAGLTNPRQIIDFNSYTRRFRAITSADVGRHLDTESHTYGAEVQKATQLLAIQNGNTYYLDPNRLQMEFTNGEKGAIGEAVNAGAPPDGPIAMAKLNDFHNRFVVSIVDRYLSANDPGGAKAWLDTHAHLVTDSTAMETMNNRIRLGLVQKGAREITANTMSPGGGGAVSPPVQGPVTPQQVAAAATRNGLDPLLANATAAIESSHGANAGSPTKKYAGVYQMGPDERVSVGGSADSIGSLDEQVDQGTKLLAMRKQQLATALGREPANWEVYLAHQQGVAGAVALINHPDQRAGQVISDVTGGKEGDANISQNGGNPNAPASAFVQHWQQVYNQKEAQFKGTTPTAATGGATASPAAAGGGAAQGKPIAIGDSIARGFQKFGGAGGTGKDLDASDTTVHASGGRSPSTILTYLKSQPDGSLNGQPVVLSTGVSNGPAQINLVPEQLAELKRMGAGPISVVGVGTKAGEEGGNRYDLNKYNAQIEQAAKAAGATFLGGLPAVVHPAASYYTGAMPKAAATAKPETAPEGAIISSPGKAPLQNVGGKWVPYLPEGV